MRHKHILNIGHAKTGTTWLWAQLGRHPQVDLSSMMKEPYDFLETSDIDQYQEHYKKYDISANFHVMTWCLDQELIKAMNGITTHATILLSDPYLFINRFYKWVPDLQMSPTEFVDVCINTKIICYKQIVDRWVNNFDQGKFRVLLYDDLVRDPDGFLFDYFGFLGLEKVSIAGSDQKINVNLRPTNDDVWFMGHQVEKINQEIKSFETVVDRDLSHWLR